MVGAQEVLDVLCLLHVHRIIGVGRDLDVQVGGVQPFQPAVVMHLQVGTAVFQLDRDAGDRHLVEAVDHVVAVLVGGAEFGPARLVVERAADADYFLSGELGDGTALLGGGPGELRRCGRRPKRGNGSRPTGPTYRASNLR